MGWRRDLEISRRGSEARPFLRDKSRAPGQLLAGANSTAPCHESSLPHGTGSTQLLFLPRSSRIPRLLFRLGMRLFRAESLPKRSCKNNFRVFRIVPQRDRDLTQNPASLMWCVRRVGRFPAIGRVNPRVLFAEVVRFLTVQTRSVRFMGTVKGNSVGNRSGRVLYGKGE